MNSKKKQKALRKIAVVTGSRADFGLLLPVILELQKSESFAVEVWATGMHLSDEFGQTVACIQKHNVNLTQKVPSLVPGDSPGHTAQSVAKGIVGWQEVFSENCPDLLVVLGDRYEILAVAQTALFFQVPIAHLCGGDLTAGAFDESIRHCLTKLSHLHFVTNADSSRRVIQMGERPGSVFNVGSPAIDLLMSTDFLSREELETDLKAQFLRENYLITFHPTTLTAGDARKEMETQVHHLLKALASLGDDVGLFFTKTNSDTFYKNVAQPVDDFCATHENAHVFTSLGQKRYWSLMSHVDAVVGNSSSGLYEAPSLKKATVDIGDRQKGRIAANSVVHCDPTKDSIIEAIQKARALDVSEVVNPYGIGGAAPKIREALEATDSFSALVQKEFYEDLYQSH